MEQNRKAVYGEADQLGCSEGKGGGVASWMENESQPIASGLSPYEGGIR